MMISLRKIIFFMLMNIVLTGFVCAQDIQKAIKQGNVQTVQELLKEKPDLIKEKDRYGLTPLHRAALYGKKDIVAVLLEKGADIGMLSGFFWTPMQYAQFNGHKDVISLLTSRDTINQKKGLTEFKGEYLGQKKPGKQPELFGQGIASSAFVDHGSPFFSRDGNMLFRAISFGPPWRIQIISMQRQDEQWSTPRVLPLLPGDYWELAPTLSPDGKRLYFASNKPIKKNIKLEKPDWRWNIYMAEKRKNGWSEPVPLPAPINLAKYHDAEPLLLTNGSFYFSSSRDRGLGGLDIYYSKLNNGGFTEPVNLGKAVNSKFSEEYFDVASDESYIIFTSNGRPEGYGQHDLYISFKQINGSWNRARNMGNSINSNTYDAFPRISPDGKYLFFASDRSGNVDVYWMDAGIIQELKKENDYFNQWETFLVLKGKYLGQEPPGKTPRKFAPGIIASSCMQHGSPTFSPKGDEVYWSTLIENPVRSKILFMKNENGKWSTPKKAPFTIDKYRDVNPVFSPDGKHLFFRSIRPLTSGKSSGMNMNIWFVERKGKAWTEPQSINSSVNTGWMTSCSLSKHRTLYFSSGIQKRCDIFRSRCVNGKYMEPEKLSSTINTEHFDMDPFIAPDESYLVFQSNRPGGYGSFDIYISIRQKNGNFGPPVNLGNGVNTKSLEAMPMLSPDGKYFFFVSNRLGTWDVFWVEAGVIDKLSNK